MNKMTLTLEMSFVVIKNKIKQNQALGTIKSKLSECSCFEKITIFSNMN